MPNQHCIEVVDYDPTWPARFARERDALRADPELRQRYAALKRRLALEFPHDREAYTEAKSPFVLEALLSNASRPS